METIRTGNSAIVDLLIRYGADIHYPAKCGINRTPLQVAIENGHIEIIRNLLDRGAYPNSPAGGYDGATALQLAARKGYWPIVYTLLQSRVDVDAPAAISRGITALQGAAQYPRLDMVVILLRAGAGRRRADQDHLRKAIAYARENLNDHIVGVLEHYAATGAITNEYYAWEELFDFDSWDAEQGNMTAIE